MTTMTEPRTDQRIVRRVLEPDEAQKAIDAGGPLADLAQLGLNAEKLSQMRICVVEVDDRIVAYWVVWYALHIEPLWIHEDFRGRPAVVGGIIQQMQEVAEATTEPIAYCEIQAENLTVVADYAMRLGFHESPGKLFHVVLQPEMVK